MRSVTSLSIRIARDFPGLAESVDDEHTSILIIGEPGSGKTTLLRDLIRQRSDRDGYHISVVDERQELFPIANGRYCFYTGKRTDVLSGCPKAVGFDTVLRCMTPQIIAVDEITSKEDCDALLASAWCGVKILATAHAHSIDELKKRSVYKPIVNCGIFEKIITLHDDNTWHLERIGT